MCGALTIDERSREESRHGEWESWVQQGVIAAIYKRSSEESVTGTWVGAIGITVGTQSSNTMHAFNPIKTFTPTSHPYTKKNRPVQSLCLWLSIPALLPLV